MTVSLFREEARTHFKIQGNKKENFLLKIIRILHMIRRGPGLVPASGADAHYSCIPANVLLK